MAHKQEFPPLLPRGFYPLSIEEMKALCVRDFPLSTSRADMMAGFEVIYEQARALGLHGDFWIDGSFLTQKIEPDDIDFIFLTPADFYNSGTAEQRAFLDWLINTEDDPKKSFRCHTDTVLIYEKAHPEHERSLQVTKHWEESVYGRSVTTGEPKGIVVVNLTEREAA